MAPRSKADLIYHAAHQPFAEVHPGDLFMWCPNRGEVHAKHPAWFIVVEVDFEYVRIYWNSGKFTTMNAIPECVERPNGSHFGAVRMSEHSEANQE